MGSWLLFVALLIVGAESAEQRETSNQTPNRCGQEKCEKFEGCPEIVGDTAHRYVPALVSEKNDQFYL
jgi:hypothetical protein